MENEVDPSGDWVQARIAFTELCWMVVQNTDSGRVRCLFIPNSDSIGSSVEVRFSDASLDFLRRLLDAGGAYSYTDHPSASTESVTDCVRQIRDRLVEHLVALDIARSAEEWRGVVKQVLRAKHGQGYAIDSNHLQITKQT